MTRPLTLIFTALLTIASPAAAGTFRHDRDIDQYRKAAANPRLACAGWVKFNGGEKQASGILIDPSLVLTCAHVANSAEAEEHAWHFGDQARKGVRVIHLKGYQESARDRWHFNGNDLAIVQLDRPINEIEPAIRYRVNDEVGKTVWCVGNGLIGDGQEGLRRPLIQERLAGTNVIDTIGDQSAYSLFSDRTLMYDFDGPAGGDLNMMGDEHPTDLEYSATDGDSGGGLFIEQDGELLLAGIFFGGVDSGRSDRKGSAYSYGEIGVAVRVSSHNDWIDAVIEDPRSYADENRQAETIRLKVIDEKRQSVENFTVLGLTPEDGETLKQYESTDEFSLGPITEHRKRTIVVRNVANTIGKVVRLDDRLLAELNGSVQLLPLATIKARLFDLSGRPLKSDSIYLSVRPNEKHLRRLKTIKTDDEGRIEVKVPCWSKYLMWYEGNHTAFKSTLSVFPGKAYDLGDIRVATGPMVPPKKATVETHADR
ncbi:Trypsin [Rubripirellula amarantea]|uniref:Trypsin n=1 Tax=Rubripirellula amarantea TaxID=2527999 RepID=A0A5C5WKX4_9BACT|nr:trypsin-like serine protease [Rubripirellula amarantea]TWT51388.1 Trypsin [Rubripirellula amarantea]